jgi:predicted ATPase/DNA-binding NarL/FixJ family response regulator
MAVIERTRQSGNLQTALTSFIGRRREVARARALLPSCRVLTLTGTGGVGKTRLALQIAASVQRGFRDGVWLVELADLTDPAMVAQTVAGAVGLRDESATPVSRLAEHLADKQALIVLDNCEHLPDECAMLLGKVLTAAPEVTVLATSRHRLGVDGEQIMQVAPFPVSSSWSGTGEGFEAVQLFVERASSRAPDFELTDTNRETVLAICQRVDGVPLAIELAAVWVATLTPEQILARLSDRFALLSKGPRGARPHQRTLQDTIGWSFSLCSAQEQTLWSRLAVFTGGFDLEAVEAVCSGDDVPREDVLGLLAGLLDKSIVIRLESTDGRQARYRMLENIQSYGLAKLAASGEEQAIRTRHRDHFRQLSMRYEAECFGPHQVEWLLRLRSDHANLRAAIEFCLSHSEGRTALEVAGPTYHWISSGYLKEGLGWLDRALAIDREPSAVRAKALWVRSFLAILLGEYDAPERTLAECRVLAEQLDTTNVFYPKIWQCSGLVEFMHGDLDRSRQLFERALEWHLRAGPGHLHCAFDCMFQLALIALHRDEAGTEQLVRDCLDFCEGHGALWSKSYALWLDAVYHWRRGDPRAALPLLHESMRLQQPVDDQTGLSFCIEVIAWCEAADERWERAATILGAASAVWKHSGANTSYDALHRFAHDEVERQVRTVLGAADFGKCYAEGARTAPLDAVALASRETRDGATAKSQRGLLTRREAETAELVAQGLSNREIAATLVISQRTAEAHVEHILVKLGFSSRTQIATWMTELRKQEIESSQL